jgi:cell wall-associated NlpC family hydrolase
MAPSPRSRVPLLALALAVGAICIPATALSSDGTGARPPQLTSENTPNIPPLTKAERVVRYALDEVGVPYRWGGESPATGFDCSGLVRWAYGQVGIDLPHSSYALYGQGRRVSESNLAPGDILFFEGLGHVGLYLGRGRMVHAPQTGRDVEIVRLSGTNYGARLIGARRIV